MRQKWR